MFSLVIRVNGRQLVRTSQLVEAQWAMRAAAQAGQGAEIVDDEMGQVIERHAPATDYCGLISFFTQADRCRTSS
jgi:hypothetical protein